MVHAAVIASTTADENARGGRAGQAPTRAGNPVRSLSTSVDVPGSRSAGMPNRLIQTARKPKQADPAMSHAFDDWKAIWSGFVILVPYVGVFFYAALRPPRPPTPTGGEDQTAAGAAIEQLSQLAAAHNEGSIADEEFSRRKYAVFGLTGPTD